MRPGEAAWQMEGVPEAVTEARRISEGIAAVRGDLAAAENCDEEERAVASARRLGWEGESVAAAERRLADLTADQVRPTRCEVATRARGHALSVHSAPTRPSLRKISFVAKFSVMHFPDRRVSSLGSRRLPTPPTWVSSKMHWRKPRGCR